MAIPLPAAVLRRLYEMLAASIFGSTSRLASRLSGESGINQESSDAFFADVAAYLDWQAKVDGDADVRFLGEKTGLAADAFQAVKEKVTDYFTRCGLAAYDLRAALPLSRSAEDYQCIAHAIAIREVQAAHVCKFRVLRDILDAYAQIATATIEIQRSQLEYRLLPSSVKAAERYEIIH